MPPTKRLRRPASELVSFQRPPVQEVVLSMQFESDTFGLEAFGRFALATRDQLPERQQHPVVPPMAETFDPAAAPLPVQIRLEPATGLPRTWFLSADGKELVQLQHDRFTLNWRLIEEGATYPRYKRLRRRFNELLKMLIADDRDPARQYLVNLCEVTYVNTIEPIGATALRKGLRPQLSDLINRVGRRPRNAFLPRAEDAQLLVRWQIPGSEIGEADGPAGRLYLQAGPGLNPKTAVPIYVVNLTAHVVPRMGNIRDAMRAMDVCHKWAVLGFKDVTTARMHRVWGLKEEQS